MNTNTPQNAPTRAQKYQTALIRRKEVERTTSLSRSRIYDLMKQGKFPKPVRLGAISCFSIDESAAAICIIVVWGACGFLLQIGG